MQTGRRQVEPKQQGLDQRHPRQEGECHAPAPGVADQRADRDAEYRGADDTETDFLDRPARVIRTDDIHRRFTGQRPEYRQAQGWQQTGNGHDPDIRRQRRHDIGQPEDHQDADEQPPPLEAREIGSEERTKRRHGKGEQRHQQPGLRDADLRNSPTMTNSVVSTVKPAADSSRMARNMNDSENDSASDSPGAHWKEGNEDGRL